jgi:indolepyruvate decarboxylase
MTGTELSTMIEQGLAPIVLLLNNGYGMLEAIDRPRNYYARRSWDYAAMARALGALAVRVTTPAELEAAMASAEANPGAFLIEAVTGRDDLSPVMARIRAHLHTPPKPRSLGRLGVPPPMAGGGNRRRHGSLNWPEGCRERA